MALLEPRFSVGFSEHFSERLTSWHLWVIGGLLEGPGDFGDDFEVSLMNDKLLVQVGQRGVPKSRTKLTRTLWYTLGTAHDFESKRLQSAKSFFISVFAVHQAQLAIIFLWSAIPLIQIANRNGSEKWPNNPRSHPHHALDQTWSSSCVAKSWRR
jgi:Photosystem I psaA/psaB protein